MLKQTIDDKWDLLSLDALDATAITALLDEAARHAGRRAPLPEQPAAGHTVAVAFYEASTRTSLSFERAAQRLGADVLHFASPASSAKKGESLLDTGRTIASIGADVIVLRHPSAGAPAQLARWLEIPVINAGDGRHEHPTQGLLDLLTIRQRKSRIDGLRVAIVGDVVNSRVARSALAGLHKLGAAVTLVGPPTLLPESFAALGATVAHDFDAVIADQDVVMMLRVQHERIAGKAFSSVDEYVYGYALDARRLAICKRDVLIMHPGPMNRGVELSVEVADDARCLARAQVANGVAVRMAVLGRALGI